MTSTVAPLAPNAALRLRRAQVALDCAFATTHEDMEPHLEAAMEEIHYGILAAMYEGSNNGLAEALYAARFLLRSKSTDITDRGYRHLGTVASNLAGIRRLSL